MWNLAFAQEQAPATPPPPGGAFPQYPGLIMVVVFFAIFYFLLIRPNQKREKERREMLAALSKGDRVITSGGILGTIVGLNDKTAVLKVSDEPAVKMEVLRGAISRVMPRETEKS